MQPAVIITLSILAILVIVLPRKYVIAPIMAAVCYLNASTGLQIGPAHFPPVRILILISLIREVFRGNIKPRWNKLDQAFFFWSIWTAMAYFLRVQTFAAFNFLAGAAIDVTGGYTVARICISTREDILFYLKTYALIMIPFAVIMIIEQIKHFNVFSFVGAPVTSYIRSGRYRGNGTFGPILSGTYGAIGAILTIPLVISSSKSKVIYLIAVIAGVTITFAGATSGAIMTLFYGLIALGCWYIRYQMKYIRIASVFMIIILSLFMKAPIWYLIAKISDFMGGTGWHRSYLIDQAIRYFGDWWLVGISVTGYWMPYQLADGNADITNQFLAQGVNGGIVPMLLYILVVVRAFKFIGMGLKNAQVLSKKDQFIIWGLGCALFGHVATFFNVSYYNSIRVLFYFQLAVIALLSVPIPSKDPLLNSIRHQEELT
jgi:hypothetical protein